MNTTPTLATRFARNTFVVRSETPLAEDQMRSAGLSSFAVGNHATLMPLRVRASIPLLTVKRGAHACNLRCVIGCAPASS